MVGSPPRKNPAELLEAINGGLMRGDVAVRDFSETRLGLSDPESAPGRELEKGEQDENDL
jgi:hypothetical protein